MPLETTRKQRPAVFGHQPSYTAPSDPPKPSRPAAHAVREEGQSVLVLEACGITFTFGGLKGDADAQVLNTDGYPTKGLYACGEALGGLFSQNYPGGSVLAEREQRRTKVTAWDKESTGQLYEMRILLESEAARLAAMRRSPHATVRLQAALDAQRNLVNPSPAERRDSTYAFHNELWQACGNPLLLEANQKYGTQSLSIAPTSLRSDERWETSIAEHQELLTAVIEHRASHAAELMRSHLESAMHHL